MLDFPALAGPGGLGYPIAARWAFEGGEARALAARIDIVGDSRIMPLLMGATYVTVAVSNLERSGTPYEASFLVDTGAIDCLASGSALNNAGIKIEGRNAYEMANGTSVELPYGFARVSFMGSETVCPIVFGPDDVEPLLGLIALEGVGIGVDPVTRTLRRWAAKPLKALNGRP